MRVAHPLQLARQNECRTLACGIDVCWDKPIASRASEARIRGGTSAGRFGVREFIRVDP